MSGPPPPPPPPRASPSSARSNDRYTVWLYLDGDSEPIVYERVKHIYWAANQSVFVVLYYTNDEETEWVYDSWLREHVKRYKRQPQHFRKSA